VLRQTTLGVYSCFGEVEVVLEVRRITDHFDVREHYFRHGFSHRAGPAKLYLNLLPPHAFRARRMKDYDFPYEPGEGDEAWLVDCPHWLFSAISGGLSLASGASVARMRRRRIRRLRGLCVHCGYDL